MKKVMGIALATTSTVIRVFFALPWLVYESCSWLDRKAEELVAR